LTPDGMSDAYFYEPSQGHGLRHDPLNAIVAPRPIGWISSRGADGRLNLAPYSFFNLFCYRPPIVGFASTGWKDSVRNARETGEFCWSLATRPLAEPMNATSAAVAPDVDEFALAGLASAPGVRVSAPRVASAPISLECRLVQIVRVGRGPHSVVFGEVVYIHVHDRLYDAATGRIDVAALRPVGRLAGHMYSRTHELFELKRPNPNYRG
jgi:flavin reductase (DIM6/NTAB) family NADH-FMN oxidoreductase RutF